MTPAEAPPTPGIPSTPVPLPPADDGRQPLELATESAARLRLETVSDDEFDVLLALTLGFDLTRPLPAQLQRGAGEAGALVDALHRAGLLGADGTPDATVRRIVLATTPVYRMMALRRELLDLRSADGIVVDDVTREMARCGVRDARLATALEHAGDAALAVEPALAGELYAEAVTAGTPERDLAARRAQAALATGDLEGAGQLVDELLALPDPPDLARAVDVAATVWARRGSYDRSADLYRWLGTDRVETPTATISLIGAGFRAEAEQLLARLEPGGPPSSPSIALHLLCEGVVRSLAPDGTAALPALIRASDAMSSAGPALPLPETPASIAGLVALHGGETAVARNVLDDALARAQGGVVAHGRLLLLSAWTDMHRDDLAEAAAKLELATVDDDAPARDRLLAAALRVGIARRSDDIPALLSSWRGAWELLLHVSPDLYALLPLGELVIAAARVRETERVRDHLADAWSLIERLGTPTLWCALLHWSGVQSAILLEQPDELAPHAAALLAAAPEEPIAGVLAAATGAWVAVLSGTSDDDAVEAACRGLAGRGLSWDGARLAGHAAARAGDRRRMARLLACARELRSRPEASTPPLGLGAGRPPARGSGTTALTAREREIARLMLDGLTQREIGEAIFVSTRTAEHHIAQLRRRLGATTRSELLAALRAALAGEDPRV